MISVRFKVIFFSFLITLLVGCSYKLGYPSNNISSIHLRIRNNTTAPMLGPKIDRELRKRLLRSASFDFVSEHQDADSRLVVTLNNYQSKVESYQANDSLLANGYNFRVSANIKLLNDKGMVLRENMAESHSALFRPKATHLPDDSTVLQSLAENLAFDISLFLLN